jgi:hypothetical protein
VLTLPEGYVRLLASAQAHAGGEDRLWISEAGLFLPEPGGTAGDWLQRLVSRRWPGMGADLLPFASDGAGNQFCFHIRGQQEARVSGVVCWGYETGRVVPLSVDWEGFTDWLLVCAFCSARTLNLPPMDEEHLQQVVLPLLGGMRPDSVRRLPELLRRHGWMHAVQVSLAPGSPASQMLLAEAALDEGDWERARAGLRRAALDMPEFAAVPAREVQLFGEALDDDARLGLLMRTLKAPLGWGGDPAMAHLEEVPAVDVAWLFESLVEQADFSDQPAPLAIFEMVNNDTPWEAESWLRAAAGCADEGDLAWAVVMASNASYFAVDLEARRWSADLLQDLYEALRWPWHRHVVLQDLATWPAR